MTDIQIELGYIKLFRKFLDWEWLDNPKVLSVFILCLLQANHKTKTWRGIEIKKGSFITSVEKLSVLSGLSSQQIRTVLNKLKSTNEIAIKTTTQYSIISINNWESYQGNNEKSTNHLTNNQQTDNKRITTTNNDKNDKNINNNILTDFDKFYSLYPKKESKEKAKVAFKKVIDSGTTIDELVNGLNRYIKEIKATNKERKYIKQPATWLNGGCWCDEYESEVPASGDEWDSSKFYTED